MTSIQKKKAMVFLGLCIFITALIAACLSDMELHPGLPSPLLEGAHIAVPATVSADPINQSVFPFILRLIGILLAIYLLVTLFSVIIGMGWKKLVRILREFSLIIAVFIVLILVLSLLRSLPGQPSSLLPAPATTEPPIFTSPDSPPAILVWVVGISLAVLAVFLLFYWIRTLRKSSRRDLLARRIEKARQSIVSGMNLEEVILRCYQEMGSIIQSERAIERQVHVTPTEFESELCAAGLPEAPIHELTHIFERVRYGHRPPTDTEEQEALSNLQKIASYLRNKKDSRPQ